MLTRAISSSLTITKRWLTTLEPIQHCRKLGCIVKDKIQPYNGNNQQRRQESFWTANNRWSPSMRLGHTNLCFPRVTDASQLQCCNSWERPANRSQSRCSLRMWQTHSGWSHCTWMKGDTLLHSSEREYYVFERTAQGSTGGTFDLCSDNGTGRKVCAINALWPMPQWTSR